MMDDFNARYIVIRSGFQENFMLSSKLLYASTSVEAFALSRSGSFYWAEVRSSPFRNYQ